MYEDAQTRGQLCRYTAWHERASAGEAGKGGRAALAAGDYKGRAAEIRGCGDDAGQRGAGGGRQPDGHRLAGAAPESEETRAAINRAVYAYAEQLVSDGQKEAAAIEFYSLGSYEDAMARGNALESELAMSEKAQDIHSALDRLEALGDYGDAAAQADECRYEIAKTAMNAGELQDALDAFEALGDVQDAPEQAQRCRHLLAQRAVSAGEYDEAIALYEACGAYLDAEDGAMQARYAKGRRAV